MLMMSRVESSLVDQMTAAREDRAGQGSCFDVYLSICFVFISRHGQITSVKYRESRLSHIKVISYLGSDRTK
jgi:hypothetical protein